MRCQREYTFGPVPSRRLGRSLGIDLVPFKACPFDCVYCQLGRTTSHTVERRTFVEVDSVLAEAADVLEGSSAAEFLTLSGSGEPTLHAQIGKVIRGLHRLSPVPVAVLTNAALLWQPEVQRDLAEADLVIPSLDAGSEEVFRRVNRPHPSLALAQVVDGLEHFRQRFTGLLWLEILLVRGVNDAADEIERMRGLVDRIQPDRVQLNTVTRPPPEAGVCAVDAEYLRTVATHFGPRAEVIASHSPSTRPASPPASDLLAMLRRRPCTLADLTTSTGLHPAELTKQLGLLREAGQLMTQAANGHTYYLAHSPQPNTTQGKP